MLPIRGFSGKGTFDWKDWHHMGKKREKGTQYQRLRLDSGHHRRILLVSLVLGLLAFVPVGLRLYRLMVTDYDYYANLALRNQTRTTVVAADRGEI